MHAVPALILFAVVAACIAEDPTTDNDINNRLNSIETKPSIRLDPYIRKALLKALNELEENQPSDPDSTDTTDSEILKTGDDVDQTTNDFQIHSFIVNGQSAFSNTTDSTPAYIDTKISILSTTTGNVENQATSTLPTQSPLTEIFQTRETVNVQQVRSIQSNSKSADDNSIKSTSKPAPTTTTSTTTTTPKPTHNNDGENIEDVDKHDVQVFQAPLVAAFTVQQDALGQPKNVIPHFQQTNTQVNNIVKPFSTSPPTAAAIVQPHILSQNVGVLPLQNVQQNQVPNTEFVNQQLELQRQLEAKQRILEEQLRFLQRQQAQQEELLRKQQFFLQQKEVQRQQELQQQQLISEQRLQANQANVFQQPLGQRNFQQNQFLSNGIRPNGGQVTIQPSVSIDQNNIPNHQQLPNREAVDFLLQLRTQQSEQFPLQNNHIPRGVINFLQPNSVPNFNPGPNTNFNQVRQEDQFRQKQANRVFRQENGVGNFGFQNHNFNRFNSFEPFPRNNFINFNNRQNVPNSDTQLRELLFQNGLNSKGQEDLNIVSKVLSLNHGIPVANQISRRPFDTRRPIL